MEIEKTLSEIERFFERAAKVDGIGGYEEVVEPATDAAIEALVAKFELALPDDVRRFWRRGLKYRSLSLDEGGSHASAGFDWLSVDLLDRDLPDFRALAENYDSDTAERALLEKGIPLSFSEPQIVWDPRGGIVHFSTRNDLTPPITRSFAEFLEHWLEAGCFSSHAVTKYLPKVQHLVPGRIPPENNVWIAYYTKVFAEYA
jgi:hypothetical protein